jgi:hypothetical protein
VGVVEAGVCVMEAGVCVMVAGVCVMEAGVCVMVVGVCVMGRPADGGHKGGVLPMSECVIVFFVWGWRLVPPAAPANTCPHHMCTSTP